jgi:hypothetical protein
LAISEFGVFPSPSKVPGKRPSIPAAVRWAVDDKHKFAELVEHLKDFIDGLEVLTAASNVIQRQNEMIRTEVCHISDLPELEMIAEARMGYSDAVADAASFRLGQLHDRPPAVKDPSTGSETRTEPAADLPPPTSNSVDYDWDVVEPTIAQTTNPDMCYQVLHRVVCDSQPTRIFFDIPSYHDRDTSDTDSQWLVINSEAPM